MSDLENQVRPWLGLMVDGQRVSLSEKAQRIVSSWAVKTAMVVEHTLSLPKKEIYWSVDERAEFRVPPHVPPGDAEATVVRLATYTGSRLVFAKGGAREMKTIALRGESVGTRSALLVGRAVLHVESHRWRKTMGRGGLWWPPPHADQCALIWPPRPAVVEYPLPAPLDDAGFNAFAQVTPT